MTNNGDLNTGDDVEEEEEEGYESFENPQDVLIASGFHNQVITLSPIAGFQTHISKCFERGVKLNFLIFFS